MFKLTQGLKNYGEKVVGSRRNDRPSPEHNTCTCLNGIVQGGYKQPYRLWNRGIAVIASPGKAVTLVRTYPVSERHFYVVCALYLTPSRCNSQNLSPHFSSPSAISENFPASVLVLLRIFLFLSPSMLMMLFCTGTDSKHSHTRAYTLMCILLSTSSLLFFPLVLCNLSSSGFLGPLSVWLGLTKNPQKLVTDIFDAFFPSLSSSSLLFLFLHSTKFLYCSYFPWAQALQKNHRWLLFPVTGNVLITGEKRWRKKRDS